MAKRFFVRSSNPKFMKKLTLLLAITILICINSISAKDYSATAGNWRVSFASNETLYTNVEWKEPASSNEIGFYMVWVNEDLGTTIRTSSIFLYDYSSKLTFPTTRTWMEKYVSGFISSFNSSPLISDYVIDGNKALIAEGWTEEYGRLAYAAAYPFGAEADNTAQKLVGFGGLLDMNTTFEILDSLHVEYDQNTKHPAQQVHDITSSTTNSPTKITSSLRGTRENPVPMGSSVSFGDGWVVTVLSVVPDATDLILQENIYNDQPSAGNQFFLARVRVDYEGEGSDTFSGSYRLRAVGPSGVGYSTFQNSAGVIPDELPSSEVFTGGSIEGNIAWQIKSSDAGSLVMYDSEASKAGRLYMALFGGETLHSSSLSSDNAWQYQGTGKMGRY